MDIVAGIFVVIVIVFGLLNSYRKYKNDVLPFNFFVGHVILGVVFILLAFYFIYS